MTQAEIEAAIALIDTRRQSPHRRMFISTLISSVLRLESD